MNRGAEVGYAQRAMRPLDFKGRWVLVTGASAGLGRSMAEQLAAEHGANLVLVARRGDVLEALAQELRTRHRVEVKVLSADLTKSEAAGAMVRQVLETVPLHAAILNAGATHFGHHDALSWEGFEKMLSLNVVSTVRMTNELLPHLEKQGQGGGLMIVSSMAGLSTVPYQTAYSATKAFLVQYATGLHLEMWPRGVSVTVFTPGGIATEMTKGAEFDSLRGWLMPVDRCARAGLKAFKQREYIAVPGFVYAVGAVLQRLVPKRFFDTQLAIRYRKSLNDASAKASLVAKNP